VKLSQALLRMAAAVTCSILLINMPSIVVAQPPIPTSTPQAQKAQTKAGTYRVKDVSTVEARAAIASTGAAIEAVGDTYVVIVAIPKEIQEITTLGYQIEELSPNPQQGDLGEGSTQNGLQAAMVIDPAYHTYAEMTDEVLGYRGSTNIVNVFTIGRSYEGREIWAAKISDNAAVDEGEPEILLVGGHHAREHITVEMTLYILHLLADSYGKDPRITNIVNTREIWIVFNLNPDGSEFDMSPSNPKGPWTWRKNRQPNVGSADIGTDLNRNYGYQWGLNLNSSPDPASETFRGSAPFSAPETAALRDFVNSRVIAGEQQIKEAISFHSYTELVLWPWSFTRNAVSSQDDRDVFVAMGTAMAGTNGYTPEQSSTLYPSDGDYDDWNYGQHGIFSFTFEMSPKSGGFVLPGAQIPSATGINRGAILYFAEQADCPYRVINKAAQHCVKRYVATTGNDFNSCEEMGKPCRTIGAAVLKAPDWANIIIAPGIYDERLIINKRVKLVGQNVVIR
jgi:carboxypeptidase T